MFFETVLSLKKYEHNLIDGNTLSNLVISNMLDLFELSEEEKELFNSEYNFQVINNSFIINDEHILDMNDSEQDFLNTLHGHINDLIKDIPFEIDNVNRIPQEELPLIFQTLNLEITNNYKYYHFMNNIESIYNDYMYHNYIVTKSMDSIIKNILMGANLLDEDFRILSINDKINHLLDCDKAVLVQFLKSSPIYKSSKNQYPYVDSKEVNEDGTMDVFFTLKVGLVNHQLFYTLNYFYEYSLLTGEFTYKEYKLHLIHRKFSNIPINVISENNQEHLDDYFGKCKELIDDYIEFITDSETAPNINTVTQRNFNAIYREKEYFDTNLFNGIMRLYGFYFYTLNHFTKLINSVRLDVTNHDVLFTDVDNIYFNVYIDDNIIEYNENDFNIKVSYKKSSHLILSYDNLVIHFNKDTNFIENLNKVMQFAKFIYSHHNDVNLLQIIEKLVVNCDNIVNRGSNVYEVSVKDLLIYNPINTDNVKMYFKESESYVVIRIYYKGDSFKKIYKLNDLTDVSKLLPVYHLLLMEG